MSDESGYAVGTDEGAGGDDDPTAGFAVGREEGHYNQGLIQGEDTNEDFSYHAPAPGQQGLTADPYYGTSNPYEGPDYPEASGSGTEGQADHSEYGMEATGTGQQQTDDQGTAYGQEQSLPEGSGSN